MLTLAKPSLVSDLEGQLANIKRIFPDLVSGVTKLGAPPAGTSIPLDTVPPAAFALNDHDVMPSRPDARIVPFAVSVWNRESWGSSTTNDQQHEVSVVKPDSLLQVWKNTYYPGADFSRTQTDLYYFANSSTEPFAGISEDGPDSRYDTSLPDKFDNHDNVRRFEHAMDSANLHWQTSGVRPVVWVLQFNFDGTSTDITSFGHVVQRWPNVDLRMSVYSRYSAPQHQPFDGASVDSFLQRGCWRHYPFHELARRAHARNFHDLGEHLDAHNQAVFFMDQINKHKLQLACSGLKKSVLTKAECNLVWPLATILAGGGSRTLAPLPSRWS